MTYDPKKHHRRSIRLSGYDYSQPGAYFVTIVAQGRQCLFGDVVDDEMRLNDAGQMVERWWLGLRSKYPHVIPDACVVMPNHFHGIVILTDGPRDDVQEGAHIGAPLQPPATHVGPGAHVGAPLQSPATRGGANARARASVPDIVQWFKTMTTNEYIRGVKRLGWTRFTGKLWQRNYYEHVIRDKDSLNNISHYIAHNAALWDDDDENPENALR